MTSYRILPALAALALTSGVLIATPAQGQWSTSSEQYYLPASFNWQFRHNYPAADRLFNAFDYGHAILYERLWTQPGAPVSLLEEKEYNFVTRELLVHPPRLPLEEAAIEIEYAKLAPEAKQMFDWAHLLHRQIYDVWADERVPLNQKDARVAELIAYYKTRRDLAFSSRPKSMELMEGQPYSLAFRKNYPKFNGLIWAYHWLQVGLYEPLVTGKDRDARQTGVLAAVARFRQMIENAPADMPRIMPMTAAVAPAFAERYPEASIIFDNLHSMHDVVSDILANPSVPRNRKRSEILRAAGRYRDDTSYVWTIAEWKEMSQMMGVANMGGPSVGVLEGFPTPTVARGAVHSEMTDHSSMSATPGKTGMAGMQHSAGMAGMAGMQHSPGMAGTDTSARADTTMSHAGHAMPSATPNSAMASMAAMEVHMRMLQDPVIRARINADSALRRMMTEMMKAMPAEHRASMERMMESTTEGGAMTGMDHSTKAGAAPAATAPTRSRAAPAKKKAPVKKPPAAMPGMDHSTMQMPPAKKPAATPVRKPAVKPPTQQKDSMPGMDHSKMKMPAATKP